MSKVAALYVTPDSVYKLMPGVDAWDEARDARCYSGPYPVVAHPPCAAWSKLWPLHHGRIRPGEGDTCGLLAVRQVRYWGGVLEQPAWSALFRAGYLPKPGLSDLWGGRSVAIRQDEWGHVLRKPTWLYLVGCRDLSPAPYPGRVGIRHEESNRRDRLGTPPLLAAELVDVARSVMGGAL